MRSRPGLLLSAMTEHCLNDRNNSDKLFVATIAYPIKSSLMFLSLLAITLLVLHISWLHIFSPPPLIQTLRNTVNISYFRFCSKGTSEFLYIRCHARTFARRQPMRIYPYFHAQYQSIFGSKQKSIETHPLPMKDILLFTCHNRVWTSCKLTN